MSNTEIEDTQGGGGGGGGTGELNAKLVLYSQINPQNLIQNYPIITSNL